MRAAFITGGNRGIGLEVIKMLLANSQTIFVFLGCRNFEAGEAVARALCEQVGPRVQAVCLDVTIPETIVKAFHLIKTFLSSNDSNGLLDLLVNNSGIMLETEEAYAFSLAALHKTLAVNYRGARAVTEAFLPLLSKRAAILATSSGCGTRTLGALREEHRTSLMDPSLDVPALERLLSHLTGLLEDPKHEYHSIPNVAYGLSKMALNCYVAVLAREHPTMLINACSPGFCNTRMCATYKGPRKPKSPALGASVFEKVLFGELGEGKTGTFFKEASKPDTPITEAKSVVEGWASFKK